MEFILIIAFGAILGCVAFVYVWTFIQYYKHYKKFGLSIKDIWFLDSLDYKGKDLEYNLREHFKDNTIRLIPYDSYPDMYMICKVKNNCLLIDDLKEDWCIYNDLLDLYNEQTAFNRFDKVRIKDTNEIYNIIDIRYEFEYCYVLSNNNCYKFCELELVK